jgi:nucleoside-diphosphate-sugar epimerase
MQADIQVSDLVDIVAGANPHVIFHLAAQVDVGTSVSDPQFDARSNVLGHDQSLRSEPANRRATDRLCRLRRLALRSAGLPAGG